MRDNPTRASIEAALAAMAEGAQEVALDANPAFVSLGAVLTGGAAGTLRLRFTAEPSAVQGNGVVAGGTLAAMLDSATAIAVLSALPAGRTCATTSLTVNMLAAGKVGRFEARASVDRVGRSAAFSRADLYDIPGDRLIATASASFAVREAD
ncbi:PaaI family thioesterase [Aquabacterium sp.]|uniref:PaaI family thioesterase n=1 Tax=Aquabacterium sp. TaxID=1872578 RepID=UPI003BAE5D81